MCTRGLVLKNNRERKKEKKIKIKREKANKKDSVQQGVLLSVTDPSSNPAELGLTSAIGRRTRFPCGMTRRQYEI